MKTRPHTSDTTGPTPAGDVARAGEDSDRVNRLAEKVMDEDREVLRALAGEQLETAREVMSRRRRALRELAK